MPSLDYLSTETRNPHTETIDQVSTIDMVQLLHAEDCAVPAAVKETLPEIAAAIDLISERLACGGRLFYVGAGTSGRLGILDASECPPTFGVPHTLVQGIIAGGKEAIFRAQEGAEDSPQLAEHDLKEKNLSQKDAVVGLAASGRTPYVIGALNYAASIGAATIAVACNKNAVIAENAAIAILPIVGPEAVTGSTRLKAGTAQKLVLNMLSTGTMIKLGKVYKNLMVDVKATNEKLKDRAVRIVSEAAEISRERSKKTLEAVSYDVKAAILMELSGCSYAQAQAQLTLASGHIASVIRGKAKPK